MNDDLQRNYLPIMLKSKTFSKLIDKSIELSRRKINCDLQKFERFFATIYISQSTIF